MKNTGLCLRYNVVYKLTCGTCNAFYISSTSRELHTRVKEHNTRSQSMIYQHRLSCHGVWATAVLAQAKDLVDLRLREAVLIRKFTPPLNNRDEISDSIMFGDRAIS
jgi:hypothetical protein